MKDKLVALLALCLVVSPFQAGAAVPSKTVAKSIPVPAGQANGAAAYQKTIQTAKQGKNIVGAVRGYFDLGSYYTKQQNIEQARMAYAQGLAYANQHLPLNHPLTGLLLCQLSTTYMMDQNFDQALALLGKGLGILDQWPQMSEVAFKLHGIRDMLSNFDSGIQSLKLYNYADAEANFTSAVLVGREIQEPGIVSVSLSSLGLAQMMQDKYEEAEACLKQAMQYAEATQKDEARLMATIAYGSLKAKQGDIDAAKRYFQQALAQHEADFKRIRISKQLFEKEVERLSLVQAELDKAISGPDEPDYAKDVLLAKKVFHWNNQNGVIRVYMAPGNDIAGWKPEYAERFKQACLQWQTVLGNQVRFEFTDNPNEKVDTRVTWNGKYDTLTGLTHYLHLSGKLVVADIDLNLQNYDGQLYDPQTVYRLSLHEVGHLLGIAGHSKNPKDIMFPSLSIANALSPRDVATMRNLYRQAPEITNPAGMTLAEYRESAEYQAAKAVEESTRHF